jgi:CO/xanthine dehydrogenase Mo-binding subunit
MTGNAAIEAAERARALVAGAVATKLAVAPDRLTFTERRVFDVEHPETGVTFAEAVQLAETVHGTIGTVGSYRPPPSPGRFKGAGVGPSPAYSYTAAVAEVAVDEDTGIVTVEHIWIAHDIGKAVNPVLAVGQIEGGVYMGLGEALMEEMAYRSKRGLVHKGPSFLDYKSPTSVDMCEVTTLLVEEPDPNGPFGAKEVGQGPLLPIPPAVANAIYDAVGVRIDEIPITPDKVLTALRLQARGQEGRYGPRSTPHVTWPEPLRVPTPADADRGAAPPPVAVHARD